MRMEIEDAHDVESFLLDSVDALCQDNTSEFAKLKILTNLQEKVQWASLNITSAEHVIGSLKNTYIYLGVNDGEFYKCQLLVTITMVLILSYSRLKNLEDDCETLHSTIQFLTDIISKVNDSSSVFMRKTACECLWEIEISYPGLLQNRLGCFFRLCEEERSVIFQSYMILFATTLKNTIVHLLRFLNNIPENSNYIKKLLSSEGDFNMKINCSSELGTLEGQFPVEMNVVGGHHYQVQLPLKFQNKEIKRVLSFLADNCHLLTSIPLFHVLLQLTHCIKLTTLSPSVFKSQFVKSLFNTMNLPSFQIVLLLKCTFKNKLFEETDSMILLQRLCHLSNQRFLGTLQRLLCFNWLINFPQDSKVERKGRSYFLAECLDFTEKAKFHPTVFDPLEMVPAKLSVLSSCYSPSDAPDLATATLMNCLLCLHKPIKQGLTRPYSTYLFRVLFTYYSRHPNSTALIQELYRFLLSFAIEHPDLIPFILDFTLSVSFLTPDSNLPCEILRNFTDYIVSLPIRKQLKNLRNFLKTFACAMRLKDIPPMKTIRYLQELVMRDEIRQHSDQWSVGNSVLHVCKNILQYHDTSNIIEELGECLLVINKINEDIDIKDRAMFYYTLLTTISTEKCSRVMNLGTSTKRGKILHLSEKPGLGTSTMPMAVPIQTTSESFLTLTSGAGPTRWSDGCEEINHGSPGVSNVEDYVSSYLEHVKNRSENVSLTIPFYLHYVMEPNENVPDMIFAVIIQIQTSSNYKKIQDIHLPYLSYKKSSKPIDGCQVVEVTFSPNEPIPAVFHVRVIYSSSAASSFIMTLKPIVIEFHDIFIPLRCSVKPEYLSESELDGRFSSEQIYKALWRYIDEHQYSRKNQSFSGAKSIVYLDMEREKVEAILAKLESHVIKRDDSEVTFGVFVPPGHHFLLRFILHPAHSVVHVATDRWQILVSLAEFLKHGKTMNMQNSYIIPR